MTPQKGRDQAPGAQTPGGIPCGLTPSRPSLGPQPYLALSLASAFPENQDDSPQTSPPDLRLSWSFWSLSSREPRPGPRPSSLWSWWVGSFSPGRRSAGARWPGCLTEDCS